MTTKRTKRAESGTLRIGDQWNAINIIAHTQPHPLKAVCELVENAIDAGAQHIHICRRRQKGAAYLELIDDGNGINLDDEGRPDFGHIATHICDSMKRHLSRRERLGVHGEFGIGLLSFWSLGEQLRMAAPDRDGRRHELVLMRGDPKYHVQPVRGELSAGTTRVIVGPLLELARKTATGEKLERYLSEELRDRIRNSGVQIQISDRISRKQLVVEPCEFKGDPLSVRHRLKTRFGKLIVELYLNNIAKTNQNCVAVCKDGTRVLHDITELISLQRPPWNDGRLEGVLDYAAFNLAPGTRSGVVPDERLDAFLSAIESIEPEIIAEVERWDRAETDKASQRILRQVHKAFEKALRELPTNEYLFFDIPAASKPEHKAARFGSSINPPGMPIASNEQSPFETASNEPALFVQEPGPLAAVSIRPRTARRQPGQECHLSATAIDAEGMPISSGVTFTWHVVEGNATVLAVEKEMYRITSKNIGHVVVRVVAVQEEHTSTEEASVKFLSTSDDEPDASKGLPSYRLEAEHGSPRRSRYDDRKNEIIINSAHRDFLTSKQTGAKHRRYIGKMYAKEVVLINFPHDSSSEIMERLIEILVRTEDAL